MSHCACARTACHRSCSETARKGIVLDQKGSESTTERQQMHNRSYTPVRAVLAGGDVVDRYVPGGTRADTAVDTAAYTTSTANAVTHGHRR